jgi:hypothetical protein
MPRDDAHHHCNPTEHCHHASHHQQTCIHESIALQRSHYPSSPDERQHRHDASASAKSQQPRPRHRPQRHVRGHVALRANAGRSRHVDTQRITRPSTSILSSAIEQVDGSRHMSVLGTQAGAPASARGTAAACFVRAYEREGSEWAPMNTHHAAPSIARCVGPRRARVEMRRAEKCRRCLQCMLHTRFAVKHALFEAT